MTLRGRLTVAFLAVVIGPLLVGSIGIAFAVRGVNSALVSDRLASASGTVAGQFAGLCQRARTAADLIASTPEAQRPQLANSAVGRRLVDAVEWTPEARPVPPGDQDQPGQGQPGQGQPGQGQPGQGQSGGQAGRTSTRPVTAGGSIGAARDCALPPITDGGVRREPVIAAVVELRRPDGAPAGQVRAAYRITPALLKRLADAAGTDVTVLLGAGTALSTLPEQQGVRLAAGAPTGDLTTRVVRPTRGQPFLLVLSDNRGAPGAFYGVLAVLLVGAILLAGLLVWRLSRATTVPIREVADAAERVAGGDLAARVPVRGRDEVGQLATTFNRMTREMQAYVTALTVSRDQLRGNLALLGDTLSSAHDLDRILDVILETVLAATGAQAGVVLLADRSGGWPGVLVAKAARNIAGRTPAGQPRVPIGTGVLGSAAATGEPIRGRVLRPDSELAPEEPRCETYIAVPFSGSRRTAAALAEPPAGTAPKRSDRVLGVLALYDRLGADDFDDSDLVTLRTFAGQAGVAVENVMLHGEADRLAVIDSATGLFSGGFFPLGLARELQRAIRFGRPLTLLSVELDQLGELADRHGEGASDAASAELGGRLRGAVRDVDLVFRLAADRFTILLPEVSAAAAEAVATRVIAAVSGRPITVDIESEAVRRPGQPAGSAEVTETLSVGIAAYPDHGDSTEHLLDAAAGALTAARSSGRNEWRVAAVPATPER